MEQRTAIDFVMRGRVNGQPITPQTIGISMFNKYNRQVEEFLTGSDRQSMDEVLN